MHADLHTPSTLAAPPLSGRVAGDALALVRALRVALEPDGGRPAIAAHLDELHALLTSVSSPGRATPHDLPYEGLAPWQLRAVERRIEQTLGDRLRLQDLAAEARLSPRHFGRAFKRATGLSPHAFLTIRRLNRACRLMADTDASLAQIAGACGLSDQAHLTRLFRQHFQQTPSRWRWENHRPEDVDPAVMA